MDAFWQSTLFIALAEMGDKSQLVSLTFAARYSWKIALAGVTLATLVVHLFSVILGDVVGSALPTMWIQVITGIAFIGFAYWTVRGDTYEDSGATRRPRFGPLLSVAGTFFLSELGDKTMLATVTLATQRQGLIGVWLGSTLGMVAADAVAIIAGQVLGRRLPERAIRMGAAAIFCLFGLLTLAQAAVTGFGLRLI
jgi:putative Ca2+/H+ antiporter (TMEM165/GDT1 family)